jgi:hypothetical protein
MTASPLAQISLSADNSVDTIIFRPLISVVLLRSSRILPIGVGLMKSTLSDAVTKREGGSSSGEEPRSRKSAADAVPELWQSIKEAIKPP